MAEIQAIEHIAIGAHDTEALSRWYCDTLGLQVIVEGKGPQGTWFVGIPGGTLIEILSHSEPARTPATNGDSGLQHLAFVVDDFEGFQEVLASKGVSFTRMIGAPGERRLAFFPDPEGNLLQLVYRPTPLSVAH